MSASLVYFIQADTGPIKIGVARNPAARMATLQTGQPARLSLLATMPGGYVKERELHAQFADHGVGGEWFRPVPGLLQLISSLPPIAESFETLDEDHSCLFEFVTVDPMRQRWMRTPFRVRADGDEWDFATDGYRLAAIRGRWFSEGAPVGAAGFLDDAIRTTRGSESVDIKALRAFVVDSTATAESAGIVVRAGVLVGHAYNLDLLAPLVDLFDDDDSVCLSGHIPVDPGDIRKGRGLALVSPSVVVRLMPMDYPIAGLPSWPAGSLG